MDKLIVFYNQNQAFIGWMPHAITILVLTIAIYAVQKIIIDGIIHRSRVEHNLYLNTILYAISAPLSVVIWLIGGVSIAIVVREFFEINTSLTWLESGLRVAIILSVGWVLKRLIDRLEFNLVNPVDGRKPIERTSALALSRLSTIVLFVIVALVLMQTLAIDVAGIITLGSAGTIVIGIAAKDLLANFFGGLMIFSDQPFKVGDQISSPDKDIEGHVEHIGWRVTVIRTLAKQPLYVQNSTFLNISIENASRMTNRQIDEIVGLRYSDIKKVPALTGQIEEMLASHPGIDAKQTMHVALKHFGASTLDCQVYCFTKTTDAVEYMHLQQEIFLKIAEIVKQHGADMAYPTITVELPEKLIS